MGDQITNRVLKRLIPHLRRKRLVRDDKAESFEECSKTYPRF